MRHAGDPLRRITIDRDRIAAVVRAELEAIGQLIVEEMKRRLEAGGHVDSRQLIDSIRYEVTMDGTKGRLRIYIDARNDYNNAWYAEFIELGSGAAHGRPGGREGTWRYKDRNGNWHTTDGMDADPFIKPSEHAVLDAVFDNAIRRMAINAIGSTKRYAREKGGR